MRTGIVLAIVFLTTLIAGVIAFTPLSFVMRQSGIAERGVGWQQARGSIWQGQVTGLSWRGEPIGAVNLESNPLRLLSGGASHHVTWVSPQGRGDADIKASRKSIVAGNANLSMPVTRRTGIDPAFSQLGASIRLSGGQLRFSGERCDSASGTVTSDIARLAAASMGRDWPILSGPLTCKDGELEALMSGAAADGTRLELRLNRATGLRVTLENADDEVKANLALAGFQSENGKLVYERPLN